MMRLHASFYNFQHFGFTIAKGEKAYLHKYAAQNEI